MSTADIVSDPVEAILHLLREKGHARYGAESVSQLQHALQAAAQAERAGAVPALTIAALLHDIGHLVADDRDAAPRGVDAHHENVAARFLTKLFPAAVIEPIRLHVAAKRYLCATEPQYRGTLSVASERSLMLQGGPFSAADATNFIQQPFARDAVELRRWDEGAKDKKAVTPNLEHYAPLVRALCLV